MDRDSRSLVGMDAIDTKQQQEIEALKRQDVAHNTELKWVAQWLKSGMRFVAFVFTLWVIISSTVIFVLLDKLDKLGPK